MKVRPNTRVAALLDAHPAVEDLLRWYEVSLDGEDAQLTIRDLCTAYVLDLDDLIVEITATVEGDDDDDDDDYDADDDDHDAGVEDEGDVGPELNETDDFWSSIDDGEEEFDADDADDADDEDHEDNGPPPGTRRTR